MNGVRGGKKAANGQSLVLTFWNFVQLLAGRPVCPSIRPIDFGGEERAERSGRSGAEVVILTNELLREHDRKLRKRAGRQAPGGRERERASERVEWRERTLHMMVIR